MIIDSATLSCQTSVPSGCFPTQPDPALNLLKGGECFCAQPGGLVRLAEENPALTNSGRPGRAILPNCVMCMEGEVQVPMHQKGYRGSGEGTEKCKKDV